MNSPQPAQDALETLKHLLAASSVLGTLLGWLPHIAALLGIIWYCCQIYDWVQGKMEKRRQERASS